jgi:hypothetical protein
VLAVERRDEPVEHGMVEHLPVPEPVAVAGLREQVRRAGHRFHPTGHDDVVATGRDHQLRDLDRADRRRADLVDRVGGDLLGDSRADRGLPRRRLARSCLEHLPHNDVAHIRGRDARPLEAGADRDRAELGRRDVRQPTAEAAERRANGGDDDGACHGRSA